MHPPHQIAQQDRILIKRKKPKPLSSKVHHRPKQQNPVGLHRQQQLQKLQQVTAVKSNWKRIAEQTDLLLLTQKGATYFSLHLQRKLRQTTQHGWWCVQQCQLIAKQNKKRSQNHHRKGKVSTEHQILLQIKNRRSRVQNEKRKRHRTGQIRQLRKQCKH